MSSSHRVQLQPAFLLHSKPFRDTSLLLELFTLDYGRIGLVARGVRSARSKLKGLLQPFQQLLVGWSGRGELATLTTAELQGGGLMLQGDVLLSGFYLNELLMRLVTRHDPHPQLFTCYQRALVTLLDKGQAEWGLRLFERDLLQELGYGLLLTHEGESGKEVEAERRYCYHVESGPQPMRSNSCAHPDVQGNTLLALARGECNNSTTLRESKLLMRVVLGHYLGPRPLASRELFRQKQKRHEEE